MSAWQTESELPLTKQGVDSAGITSNRGRAALVAAAADRAAKPRAARITQRERILRWALSGRVLHQDDWHAAGADGGSRITAVRSRVADLEAEGYGFHHLRRPDGSVEYRLTYVPERAAAPPPAERDVDVDPGSEQLALELPRSRPHLYDVDEAA